LILCSTMLALVLAVTPVSSRAQDDAQPVSPEVVALMEQMSTEEKVGQLFLVTFVGNDTAPTSDIARLIRQGRVGGVVLSPGNSNFLNDARAPERVATLSNELQQLAFTVPITTAEAETSSFVPIPLFIAIAQEGDGYPYSSIWNGLTPLPSEMALGATWKPSSAEQVGTIVGQELSALGVNMLLGPSLDVVESPRPNLYGTLGIRTFVGDSYWAGQFGKAYIRGVHQGSDGRLLTVAKNFPGLGGADRDPNVELPTIQKNLETLRSVELAPFVAVTAANSEDTWVVTDALMSSHVRYRGFQGNIRQLTRPISLDAQNLPAILSLSEFATWREGGGLLVSDALGVPSIRSFYDPTLQSFPAKRIAQEALLAGNDLLYISEFALTSDWAEQLANLEATLVFFREKYETDPNFRARVDESLARVLQKKLDAFGEFTLQNVSVQVEEIPEIVGQRRLEIARIAQEGSTLIYPDASELSGRLPSPPLSGDQILIISDDRQGQDCPLCPLVYSIEPFALESLILQLYGPNATGQISPEQVNSLTFSRLKQIISQNEEEASEDEPEPSIRTLEQDKALLTAADWIIFAMLDVDVSRYPSSDALKLFLKERTESMQGTTIIVLAFNAPYYLDATEVSKLTAYYGLYSKTQPYLETAVRLLFQEFQPQGSLPVDVDAVGYDLLEVTRPDPNQVINIDIVAGPELPPATSTPAATPQPSPQQTPIPIQLDLEVGDELTLRTGVIVDHNGRPVPDGTPVEFRLLDPLQGLEARLPAANTVGGIGTTTFKLERAGTWEVTAASDAAQRSVRLILTIPETGPVEVGFDRPTATATATATPTPTDTPSPSPTRTLTPSPVPPTVTPTATPESGDSSTSPGKTVNTLGLFLSLIGLVVAASVTYRDSGGGTLGVERRVFCALVAVAFGLTGYVLFGAGLVTLDRIPLIARALRSGMPYETLPVLVSLTFALVGGRVARLLPGRGSVDRSQGR
jgi:beta-N-acetylhexosaminidase